MEFVKENLFGILIAALIVVATGIGTLARHDYQAADAIVVSAEIIGYDRAAFEDSTRHHFIVKLSTGEHVKVYDKGKYQTSYRGPARITIGKGVLSGKVIYNFADNHK